MKEFIRNSNVNSVKIEKYQPDDELQKTLYVSRLKERFNDCLIQLNNIKNTQIDYLKESGK